MNEMIARKLFNQDWGKCDKHNLSTTIMSIF